MICGGAGRWLGAQGACTGQRCPSRLGERCRALRLTAPAAAAAPSCRDGPPPGFERGWGPPGPWGPAPYDRRSPPPGAWERERGFRGPPPRCGVGALGGVWCVGSAGWPAAPLLGALPAARRTPPDSACSPTARRREGGPPPHGARDRSPASPPRGGRERSEPDERPDILRLSYDEYVQRFKQLKEVQAGGTGGAAGADSKALALVPSGAGGKENGSGAAEGGAGGGGGGGGPPNVQLMAEDEYVEACQRCAGLGAPAAAAAAACRVVTASRVAACSGAGRCNPAHLSHSLPTPTLLRTLPQVQCVHGPAFRRRRGAAALPYAAGCHEWRRRRRLAARALHPELSHAQPPAPKLPPEHQQAL